MKRSYPMRSWARDFGVCAPRMDLRLPADDFSLPKSRMFDAAVVLRTRRPLVHPIRLINFAKRLRPMRTPLPLANPPVL